MNRYQLQFPQFMFLKFLGQILAFNSADSDTDVTVKCPGMVWSSPLVPRGKDVETFAEFLMLTVACTILISTDYS